MNAWRYLRDDGAGAAEGLALDEALMGGVARDREHPTPTLRLYTYASHAALVGRYQTLAAEVDLEACAASGTGVGRRPTGGGAIVMGADQLGVALVLPAPATAPRLLLPELAGGILEGLGQLGIHAEFGGKNDLLVAGRKIAGLGVYVDASGGLLFHASLLGDLDVEFMLSVLRIPAAKLADKAVAAVSERVTTVRRELGREVALETLREAVAAGMAARHDVRLQAGLPTDAERAAAAELVASRYADPAWLHETNAAPDGTGSALLRGPEGLVRVYVALQGRLIKSVLFTGDFSLLPAGLRQLEAALRWRQLERETLRRIVRATAGRVGPDRGWGEDEDLLDALLGAGERARERGRAAPIRPSGSCYFPDAPHTASASTAQRSIR